MMNLYNCTNLHHLRKKNQIKIHEEKYDPLTEEEIQKNDESLQLATNLQLLLKKKPN